VVGCQKTTRDTWSGVCRRENIKLAGQMGVDTRNVALGRWVWTREMWLWTGGCGHEKCGSGQAGVDTRNVALYRRVRTR
jgi:hypothetical protein